MNMHAVLSPREREIVELLAWGAAAKEVADHLFISQRTVEKTAQNIYRKLEIQKVSELCCWYFCTRFCISMELSPIKRKIITVFLLAITLSSIFDIAPNIRRTERERSTRRELEFAMRVRSRRTEDYQLNTQQYDYQH